MSDPATVLGHTIERKRGSVHALFSTDRGPVALRFTPADAQVVGSDLRMKAVQPVGERDHGSGGPILKPGGGIL